MGASPKSHRNCLQSSSDSDSEERRKKKKKTHKKHGKPPDHSNNVKLPAFDGVQKHYREYRGAVKRYAELVGNSGTGLLAVHLKLTGEALEIAKNLSA